jgi:hypothetical protein
LPAVMHIEGIVRNFLGLLIFLGHISLLLSGNGERSSGFRLFLSAASRMAEK